MIQLAIQQCLFYGLDNDLRTGQAFYGRDLFKDGMIFYKLVVDRPDMYFSCGQDDIFKPSHLD